MVPEGVGILLVTNLCLGTDARVQRGYATKHSFLLY